MRYHGNRPATCHTKLLQEKKAERNERRDILIKKLFEAVSLRFLGLIVFLVKTISKLSKHWDLCSWTIEGSDTGKHVFISAKNLVNVVN